MSVTDNNGSLVLSGVLMYNDRDDVLLLRRKDRGYLETPGGKVEGDDCKNLKLDGITFEDLERAAIREMFEELGQGFIVEELDYVGSVSFTLSDGRGAVAHKFSTTLLFGEPVVNEPETFSNIEWVSSSSLVSRDDLSSDLTLLSKNFLNK